MNPHPPPQPQRRERLSSPLEELGASEEIVVVGSGYGGAIMASRLARAGRSVVVLERGSERHPGEFADRLRGARGEVQVSTAAGRIGSRTALFDLRLARGQTVLVGCGLGGTSLINANVALRAGSAIFDDERWPSALRGDGRRQLDPYYERAEAMLGSHPYPDGWPRLPKLEALAQGGAALGAAVERLDLNVTFEAGVNPAGVHQEACNLCGDCCSGCNVGAKNTVLMNYLPDARAHGARLFTESSVQRIRRDGDRWRLEVETGGRGGRRGGVTTRTVTAEVVVLAAGTLGTTEILLRSAEAGLPLSGQVGKRFNGNGDVLGFAYDTGAEVDAVGWGAGPATHPVGPTITGRLALVDPAAGDEVTVEEGAIPGIIRPLVGPATVLATLCRRDLPLGRRLRLAARALRSASRRTLTYLVMSTDDGNGRLRLGRRGLTVEWRDVGTSPVVASDNQALRTAAEAIGGSYLAQPMWSKAAGFSLVTVHPLGGCVMADRAEDGVVDDCGRVFAGRTGSAVHENLIVADGSVVPRPLDVNPLLTISALAERSADALIAARGW